jgi:two-component system chemotaxis response regulator CheY
MPKIMITDDSLFIRSKLANLLAAYGYETVQAGDGVQAVHVYREARPDVVLMDITMPRMNGLEALAEIRRLDPRASIIMLTALDQKLVVANAILAGARDFLTKPIHPERLIMALEKALR